MELSYFLEEDYANEKCTSLKKMIVNKYVMRLIMGYLRIVNYHIISYNL